MRTSLWKALLISVVVVLGAGAVAASRPQPARVVVDPARVTSPRKLLAGKSHLSVEGPKRRVFPPPLSGPAPADVLRWVAAVRSRSAVVGGSPSAQRSGWAEKGVAAHSPAIADLPTTGDYHDWPDWHLWRAVGLCEQRGDGPDGIAWHGSPAGGTASSGYPGGLGMSRDFWAQFAPLAGVTVTNGADATPGEQIRVARAGSHDGTRMGGWSSWRSGCVAREGG